MTFAEDEIIHRGSDAAGEGAGALLHGTSSAPRTAMPPKSPFPFPWIRHQTAEDTAMRVLAREEGSSFGEKPTSLRVVLHKRHAVGAAQSVVSTPLPPINSGEFLLQSAEVQKTEGSLPIAELGPFDPVAGGAGPTGVVVGVELHRTYLAAAQTVVLEEAAVVHGAEPIYVRKSPLIDVGFFTQPLKRFWDATLLESTAAGTNPPAATLWEDADLLIGVLQRLEAERGEKPFSPRGLGIEFELVAKHPEPGLYAQLEGDISAAVEAELDKEKKQIFREQFVLAVQGSVLFDDVCDDIFASSQESGVEASDSEEDLFGSEDSDCDTGGVVAGAADWETRGKKWCKIDISGKTNIVWEIGVPASPASQETPDAFLEALTITLLDESGKLKKVENVGCKKV